MCKPLVSIIIPCYNAERYVGEAIESALAQTYPNKEVIVIDDGSTDGSLEVIKSFGDRIRWETGPNRGGSAARNRGLELARGELIQFLDADDLLHPQKLERQVPIVLQHPESLVYCDYVVCDIETGEVLEIPKRDCDGVHPIVFALHAGKISTSAPVHRKRWLEQVGGFDPVLPCAQEYDLHIRLSCCGLAWHHLCEVLYTVRRRTGSVSSDYSRVLTYHPYIFEKALGITSFESAEEREAVHRAIAERLCAGARHLIRLNKHEIAREHVSLARKMHPSAGVLGTYGPVSRLLLHLFGPIFTERLVVAYRAIRSRLWSIERSNRAHTP